ncbi:hypothetical protein DFH09DRAFT_1197668 [Mycena vulgaris]|nr:hypothetical protein DFH09DRAFT_1197668 [Mycena vulgaris]
MSLPQFPTHAALRVVSSQCRRGCSARWVMRRGRRDGATGRPQRVRGVCSSEGRRTRTGWRRRFRGKRTPTVRPWSALQIIESSPAQARLPLPLPLRRAFRCWCFRGWSLPVRIPLATLAPLPPSPSSSAQSRPRSARLHSSYLEAATATQLAAPSVRAGSAAPIPPDSCHSLPSSTDRPSRSSRPVRRPSGTQDSDAEGGARACSHARGMRCLAEKARR